MDNVFSKNKKINPNFNLFKKSQRYFFNPLEFFVVIFKFIFSFGFLRKNERYKI
jgi:hypothetical protein